LPSADIKKLATLFLYADRPEASPYPDLQYAKLRAEVELLVVRDYCVCANLSPTCVLRLVVAIGIQALVKLARVASIMKEKRGLEWSQQNELPIEIPVPEQAAFHSIFICPVMKEQTTKANPPCMLQCGHIICKEALNRLSKGNAMTKFKCPYCPNESTAKDALHVHF
jgi:hypothetical protein